MQFRTEIHIPASPARLSLGNRIVTIGSCFADVIGNQLHNHKLSALVNPFGTIFNPVSQLELLEAALLPEEQEELPLVQQNGRWYAYNFHSTFSDTTRQGLREQVDFQLNLVREELEKANLLVLTFGTALVYQLAETDRIVANCHKVPQDQFTKRLLLAEEVVSYFTQVFALLKNVNPGLRVVVTVSPVRHLKETLVLNSVSKSVLRTACHYLSELLPDVEYFPAYELLMDDLRDYRFYKSDLLHPTEMAEQYVWQKFSEAYFDQELKNFASEWASIRQSLSHKPFQVDSPGHQDFLLSLQNRLQKLAHLVDVSEELKLVRSQIMPVRKNRSPKKATRELVSLLETLAASDVMSEEMGTRHYAHSFGEEERAPREEEFVWPDQEEEETVSAVQPVAEPEEADIQQQAEPEVAEEMPTAPADLPSAIEQVKAAPLSKKSKSKKRREKRKAKLIAARESNQSPSLQPAPDEVPAAEPGNEPAVAAEMVPEQQVTEPRAARNKQKTGRGRKPRPEEKLQAELAQPEPQPSPQPQPQPEQEPQAEAQQPAPKKRPGRKPAANVGALLTALAQAQAPAAPGKTRAARNVKKPAPPAAQPPAPEPAPVTIPEAAPAAAKPAKRGRPARKPAAPVPELPFAESASAERPHPEPAVPANHPAAEHHSASEEKPAAQAPAKQGKEVKSREAKKAGAATKRGGAKKIVLKKTPAGKPEKS